MFIVVHDDQALSRYRAQSSAGNENGDTVDRSEFPDRVQLLDDPCPAVDTGEISIDARRRWLDHHDPWNALADAHPDGANGSVGRACSGGGQWRETGKDGGLFSRTPQTGVSTDHGCKRWQAWRIKCSTVGDGRTAEIIGWIFFAKGHPDGAGEHADRLGSIEFENESGIAAEIQAHDLYFGYGLAGRCFDRVS